MAGPFNRALAIGAAIATALSTARTAFERRAALDALPVYKSRGKGRGGKIGHNKNSGRTVAQDKRAARKHKNRVAHKRGVR